MEKVIFKALGTLEVSHEGEVVSLGSPKQRSVLGVLLAEAGRPVPTDTIIERVWGDAAPRTATKSVQKYVSQLRDILGADRIEHRSGYSLMVDDGELDLTVFEDLLREADTATDPETRLVLLDEALKLYRGEPFTDLDDLGHLDVVRARFSELRLTAIEQRHDALLSLGKASKVVASTEALIAEHPLRERLWLQRIIALARTGRQADALRAYQQVRTILADELGINPSLELQNLERSVLLQEETTHLGDSHRTNLPAPTGTIIGRDIEVSAVLSLLTRSRPVTLVGAGGTGKTTTALEVARVSASARDHDVWLIELAALPASGDVAATVAAALGLKLDSGSAADEVVADFLGGSSALVVIDNCEHVLGQAVPLIRKILRRAPSVTVMATSREALAVGQEALFRVDPLPVPPADATADEITDFDAVTLLLERARSVNSAVDESPATRLAMGAIARRLDGLPLALELAAAQLRVLSPTELLGELDGEFATLTSSRRDISERHRSMEAAISWSHRLLDDESRALFEELAVFRDGFALDAVSAVCPLQRSPVAMIASLVDRSLVSTRSRSTGSTRYHLLEPIREFAEQQLISTDRLASAQQRHGAWALALSDDASAQLRGSEEATGAARIESDFANIRAAALHAIGHGDLDTSLGIAASLGDYAYFRLRDEFYDWTRDAILLEGAAAHPLYPEAAGALARGLLNRGDQARAIKIARALVDRYEPEDVRLYHAYQALATGSIYVGRHLEALEFAQRGFELARRACEPFNQACAYRSIVLAHAFRGEFGAATGALSTFAELAPATGNPTQRAWYLHSASEVARHDRPMVALELLREAIEIAESVRSSFVLGIARLAATRLEVDHGAVDDALRSFRWLIEHWRRSGDWAHLWNTLLDLADLLDRLAESDAAGHLRACVEQVKAADHDADLVESLSPHLSREEMVDLARTSISRLSTDD